MKKIVTLLVVGLAVLEITLSAQPAGRSKKVYPEKQAVLNYLDTPEAFEKYGKLSDAIWSYPELGLEEFRSAGLLAKTLEEEGFAIEMGLAGMPTCFIATYGSGKPVIGILMEYDALPMISQKGRVPQQDPVVAGAPGHGCGHNMMGTASAAAAIAVKKVMESHGLKGTIKVFGSPSEESLISRPYMIRAGLFEGVDAVIDNHANTGFGTTNGVYANAMYSTIFTFRGKAAHSAEEPWNGRSALDAVELMNIATNFLREHLYYTHRMHYVILEGGEAPNVVPDKASVWYFVRETDERVQAMYEQVINCAKAAALATGTTLEEIRCLVAIHQKHVNNSLANLIQKNIEMVGMPEWTADDEQFALELQKNLGVNASGMPKKVDTLGPPTNNYPGGGSTDVGDVTLVAPTATVLFPGVVPGAIWHHWSLVSCTYGETAWKGLNAGAKVIAATAMDLLTQPAELKIVREEFENYSKEHPYVPFLPADSEPPLDLNRELMLKYRPLMEPHMEK
jgi:aminobenzoyl-glutamate utilization protein B